MKVMFRVCLACWFWMFSSAVSASPECADFLRAMADPPKSLEFFRCESEPKHQGAPLTASYRVKGKDAHEVERYLQQEMGLEGELKFVCCGWETAGFISYRDKATGRQYQFGMGSEETPYNQRLEWDKIGYFYVTVVLYTEEI
ncbi:DUF4952 domain-containing protein [Pseudomonas sp. Fl5BN2]|uniref:DUF4952 domain-containing protein n=1 Tax=unclassified Pseudomonas TaxID=196821 RepID=UPI001376782F|nr:MULTISPECIES: DUF4952 domain-containing protein [unclassified Pseudomonas]NBF05374.1 DUF4952 domain-containing protein [Pseudomonas sp. Fl5BN2]NBF07496.1 DUF4952 domain-containing protein [Pseudomonas sp. Fl4BN1]